MKTIRKFLGGKIEIKGELRIKDIRAFLRKLFHPYLSWELVEGTERPFYKIPIDSFSLFEDKLMKEIKEVYEN